MIQGMNAALSGLRAYASNTRSTADNLANVNTTGFKRSTPVNESAQNGGGVQTSAIRTQQSQGSIYTTGRGLDVAIEGPGFFRVTTPEGATGYTRAGSFSVDNQNRLVDAAGNRLSPDITIPGQASGVVIENDGSVTAMVNGTRQTVGNIETVSFNNPGGLERGGGNVYYETSASGQPVSGAPGSGGLGEVRGGALEMSNVDIGQEMVSLIQSETGFKAQVKTIQAADEMLGSLMNIKA